MLEERDYAVFAQSRFIESNMRLAKVNFAFCPSESVEVKGAIFRPDGVNGLVDPDEIPSIMMVREKEGEKVVEDTYHFLRQNCTYHSSIESVEGKRTSFTTDRDINRLLKHGNAFCKIKRQLQNQPLPLRLSSVLDEIEYSHYERLKQEQSSKS